MKPATQWQLLREQHGFTLVRPRPNFLSETASFFISGPEAGEWRMAVGKILKRIDQGNRHTLPMTLGLRCMLGCWNGNVRRARYLGRLVKDYFFIVTLDETMYFINNLGDSSAYPISRTDLASIHAKLIE